MGGMQVAVFALTIAGYATGWYARGGSLRRTAEPAGSGLPDDAHAALVEALSACGEALDSPVAAAGLRLRDAIAHAESVDVALEVRLGADDPRYQRFERMLDILVSVAHQAAAGAPGVHRLQALRAQIGGVASELDAAHA